MNTMPGTIGNSCQYTPVYLIQEPGTSQGNSYFLAQSFGSEQKPSDNLKAFYESSGNIESNVVNVHSSPKPRILKKQDSGSIGNNLKLASFLLPKNDNTNIQYVVNNVVLKPPVSTSNTTTAVNTVPKFDVDSKIVKLKDFQSTTRYRPDKILPKIKPKEITTSTNASKHTLVQLLKLGETYHSLNELSDDQKKMVNQALKIFNDPEKVGPEHTYDPVTNTKFIYKVISPRDLTVVGKNKIIMKEKSHEIEKDFIKKTEEILEAKVTRSGRKVKLPRQILPEESPQKPKKKFTNIACFQCFAEFTSLYRLQKHYESHPTHIPAKIHSNLFHCLLAIIKSGSEEDRTKIFIQQLEQLIVKLKSLLPCLLKGDRESKPCTINDDIGRLFGMDPGTYKLDVEALNCVKDKNGYCNHNHNESQNYRPIINDTPNLGVNTDDCARINSAKKWPTVNKRVWKLKHKSQENAKKMRLTSSENGDMLVELVLDNPNDLHSNLKMGSPRTAQNLGENGKLYKLDINSSDTNEFVIENNNPVKNSRDSDDKTMIKPKIVVIGKKSQENSKNIRLSTSMKHDPLIEYVVNDIGPIIRPEDSIAKNTCNGIIGSQSGSVFNISPIFQEKPLILRSIHPAQCESLGERSIDDKNKSHKLDTCSTFDQLVSVSKTANKSQGNSRKLRMNLSAKNDSLIKLVMEENNSTKFSVSNSIPLVSETRTPDSSKKLGPDVSKGPDCVELGVDDFVILDENITNKDSVESNENLHKSLSSVCKLSQDKKTNILSINNDSLIELAIDNTFSKSNNNNMKPQDFNLNENSKKIRLNITENNSFIKLKINEMNSFIKPVESSYSTITESKEQNVMTSSHDIIKEVKTNVSEDNDALIGIVIDDLVNFSKSNGSSIDDPQGDMSNINQSKNIDNKNVCEAIISEDAFDLESLSDKPLKNNQMQFHSAHFDIRSSPIKPSSTVFQKFQINPEKLAKYEAQVIRSLDMVKKDQEKDFCIHSSDNSLQDIFKDNELSCKDSYVLDRELKDWILNRSSEEKAEDNFGKTNSLIEPAMMHMKDEEIKIISNFQENDHINTPENNEQDESVLNFLDTLGSGSLAYPGTEIRTSNIDYHLDLFSYNS